MKRLFFSSLLGAILIFGTVYYLVPIFFPLPENLENEVAPRGLLFVDRTGEPLRRLLDGEYRADDQLLLSQIEEVDETLFKLRATIPPEARDYHDAASDLIEAAVIYLILSFKETSIATQRLEQTQDLLETLISIKVGLGMPIKVRTSRD